MEKTKSNRETWLNTLAQELRVFFLLEGFDYGKVRISCGFTGVRGGARNEKAIGVAYNQICSADHTTEIFISPEIDDPIRVGDILIHELIHAILPNAGHGKEFRSLALAMGLTGPMRATVATPELKERLSALVNKIGAYPHAKINLSDRPKQPTRLIKIVCPQCGAIAYMTRIWIDSCGTPTCGCGSARRMEEK